MFASQRITIIKVSHPKNKGINEKLLWLGTSLGLFGIRDKDKSCFRIFIELLKSTKADHPLTSDEMSLRLSLSRGTVIHHMNRLMESGLAVNHKNRYMLRVDNLELLIDEVQRDLDRMTHDLKEVAKQIDDYIGK